MRTTGYSIWLVPEGEVYRKLDQLIVKLSRKYKSPYFAPHVTLIGEILLSREEAVKRTKILAYSLNPFAVYLNKVGYDDFYFKSLFLFSKRTRVLLLANKRARNIFNMRSKDIYTPHLSLIYSGLPENVKKKITNEIGKKFSVSFKVKKLYLYKTDGEVEKWKKIAEFVL